MTKQVAQRDERQGILFDEMARPPAPYHSDARALRELREMIEVLGAATSPPWSVRLLGWQRRRFATLTQLLTPIEAAALTARFEAELARLGEPDD